MSIILFFGTAAIVLIVGFTLVAVTIHHHWQQWRLKVNSEKKS